MVVVGVIGGASRIGGEGKGVLAWHLALLVVGVEEGRMLVGAFDPLLVGPRVAPEAVERLQAEAVAAVGQFELARHMHPTLPHLNAAYAYEGE